MIGFVTRATATSIIQANASRAGTRSTAVGCVIRTGLFAAALTAASTGLASAHGKYDGAWSLSIVTHRGACDQYNFPVHITNGQVSFPGLNKASGQVTANGGVRVFVSAMGKSASGSGKLSLSSGGGRWSGKSGNERCSGTWTAQRT